MPNVVELWQAEEGELLLPTQVRTAEVTGRLPGSGAGGPRDEA